jgi:UDP-N-acetylmuramoyl-tripeptide--D-alanyl-D-alanine ligase
MAVIAPLISPNVAIITTIGAAHLDRLGTIQDVAAEKAVLAQFLRSEGVAVFPGRCLEFDAFACLEGRQIVALSNEQKPQQDSAVQRFTRYTIEHQADCTQLTLSVPDGELRFEIRKTSTGMAENAVLAIVVALELGVSSAQISERVRDWRPAALRGEVRTVNGRIVYLDCYNANPVSMADALEGFLSFAPAGHPRLFVVGSMEELGSEAAEFHRATGRDWPLEAGDQMIVFGTHAEELAEGAREVSPVGNISVNPDREEAARILREFPGAVFLKGSRRYALETLLGDSVSSDSVSSDANAGEVAA